MAHDAHCLPIYAQRLYSTAQMKWEPVIRQKITCSSQNGGDPCRDDCHDHCIAGGAPDSLIWGHSLLHIWNAHRQSSRDSTYQHDNQDELDTDDNANARKPANEASWL